MKTFLLVTLASLSTTGCGFFSLFGGSRYKEKDVYSCLHPTETNTIAKTCTDFLVHSYSIETATLDAKQKDCTDRGGVWSQDPCDEKPFASCARTFKNDSTFELQSIHYYDPLSVDEAKTLCATNQGFSFELYEAPQSPLGLP